MKIIVDEKLPEKAYKMGEKFRTELADLPKGGESAQRRAAPRNDRVGGRVANATVHATTHATDGRDASSSRAADGIDFVGAVSRCGVLCCTVAPGDGCSGLAEVG